MIMMMIMMIMMVMTMLNNIRPVVSVFSIAATPSRRRFRDRFASLVTSSGRDATEVRLVSRDRCSGKTGDR